jgi:CRP-like cAMP-binding protein
MSKDTAKSAAETAGAAAALGRNAFLRALSEDARNALVARGTIVSLESGERLFAKNDAGDALFVVLAGELEVGVATAGGREVHFASVGTGDVLGEIASLDGGGRSADVTAHTRCRLLRIGREPLIEALEGEPRASLALAIEMARRLRATDAAMESAVLYDLGAKLAKLVLEESGGGAKRVTMSQGEMARHIGVSREKVNRKLADWRMEGAVEIGKSGLRVLDIATLRELIHRQETE